MRRCLQVDLTPSTFVAVIGLNLERVVQLQDHRPGTDLKLARLSVVTDVRVLDVVVPIISGHEIREDNEREQDEGIESWSHCEAETTILGYYCGLRQKSNILY